MIALTENNIKENLKNVNGLYAIRFYSPTCGPCHTMKPVFDFLEKQHPEISFFEVDSSTEQLLAEHYQIRGVPALLFCEEANVIYNVTGVTPLVSLNNIITQLQDGSYKERGEIEPLKVAKSYFVYWAIGSIVLAYVLIGYLMKVLT